MAALMTKEELIEKLNEMGYETETDGRVPRVLASPKLYEKRQELFAIIKKLGYNCSVGVRLVHKKEEDPSCSS